MTNSYKIPINFKKLLNLDLGRCFIGFLQNSINGNCAIDLMDWKMLGYNIFNNEDAWNGLTIHYDVKWPINLMLSSELMEKYQTLFRFLFPIRLILILKSFV